MNTRARGVVAAAMLLLAACGGADPPGERPVGEPIVVAPVTPGNASYYVNRADDVAGQLENRNQDLENQQP